MRPLIICAGATALLVAYGAIAGGYPAAPRGDTTDDYFGTRVADPYRWLEEVDSAQTQAWVQAQNNLSAPLLASLPERAAIAQRLTGLWNHERYDLPEKHAGLLFYSHNDGLQNQPVLFVQQPGQAPRALLDPNTLAADGTAALADWKVSKDGRWLAYAIEVAGSDWNEVHVRSVADGQDSADLLQRVKFSELAWTADNAGFFYSRYPGDAAAGKPGVFEELHRHKLYYHRLGTPQAQDPVAYEDPQHPDRTVTGRVSDDGRYLLIYPAEGASNHTALYYKDLRNPAHPKLDTPLVRLVDNYEHAYEVIGSRGRTLYVLTDLDAPRQRLAAIDLAAPRRPWRTVIAEGADTLDEVLHAGDGFIAVYMHDATARLLHYTLDGKVRGTIKLPGLGALPQNSSGRRLSGQPGDTEVFYAYTSFNTPPTNYRYDLGSGKGGVFQAPALNFQPDDYVTEQVFYTSRDGTRAPLFISYKKGLKRSADTPAYLYGYGGFNVSKPPEFSVPNLVWMERGGIYAHAVLRGGGEYGSAWHEAGTRERKQNVFDDYTAAAGYLIAKGWTSPAHLAIGGRSNGGLLVGAALNQHPELYAAALPAVGVMDMLRFHKFTIGHAWVTDYGSSDDAAGFKYLSAYSPYHNIKPGTVYPAVLVTTADHDDRVFPAHSFKYTAALQAAQAGDKPVLIRIDTQAGHGAGKPVSKKIDEWADQLAFIAHYTR